MSLRNRLRSLIVVLCALALLLMTAPQTEARKPPPKKAVKSSKAKPVPKKGAKPAKSAKAAETDEAPPEENLPPGSPAADSALFAASKAKMEGGAFREAIPGFRTVAGRAQDPILKSSAAYYTGQCFYQSEAPEEAIPWFFKALQGDPNREDACYYKIGASLASTGNMDGAKFMWQRTITYFPGGDWAKNAKVRLDGAGR